jgi:hypothetical protein
LTTVDPTRAATPPRVSREVVSGERPRPRV